MAIPLLACFTASAAAQTARWTLAQELRIGSQEGENALSRVPGLTVAPDGSIYVSQPLARSVWVFDARGRRLANVGRRGSGPGEFLDPREVGWRGDSLWATDAGQGRVTLFPGPTRPVTTITVGGGLYPLALLSDGTLLARENPMASDIGGGTVRTIRYFRVSRSGARLGTVAEVDTRHGWMFIRNPAPGRELPNTLRAQPFSDMRLVVASANGRSVVVVDRPAASSAGRAEFTVTRYDGSGRRVWISRVPYTPRRLTRELIEDSVAPQARMIAAIPDFGATPVTVAGWIRAQLYTPRYLPPVSAAVVGRDGSVWLRREPIHGQPVQWTVLNANGRAIANVQAPAGLRIFEADADRVWGIARDELEVPYVMVYRIARTERR